METPETEVYPREGVYKVASPKSIPPQIRQLIVFYYKDKELVDRFVRELTCAKWLVKFFL